jgi:hypothetical protein
MGFAKNIWLCGQIRANLRPHAEDEREGSDGDGLSVCPLSCGCQICSLRLFNHGEQQQQQQQQQRQRGLHRAVGGRQDHRTGVRHGEQGVPPVQEVRRVQQTARLSEQGRGGYGLRYWHVRVVVLCRVACAAVAYSVWRVVYNVWRVACGV